MSPREEWVQYVTNIDNKNTSNNDILNELLGGEPGQLSSILCDEDFESLIQERRLDVVICYLIEKQQSYTLSLEEGAQFEIDFTDGRKPDETELATLLDLLVVATIDMNHIKCIQVLSDAFPDIKLPVERLDSGFFGSKDCLDVFMASDCYSRLPQDAQDAIKAIDEAQLFVSSIAQNFEEICVNQLSAALIDVGAAKFTQKEWSLLLSEKVFEDSLFSQIIDIMHKEDYQSSLAQLNLCFKDKESFLSYFPECEDSYALIASAKLDYLGVFLEKPSTDLLRKWVNHYESFKEIDRLFSWYVGQEGLKRYEFQEDIVILEALLMKSEYMSQKSFKDLMLAYKDNSEILGALIKVFVYKVQIANDTDEVKQLCELWGGLYQSTHNPVSDIQATDMLPYLPSHPEKNYGSTQLFKLCQTHPEQVQIIVQHLLMGKDCDYKSLDQFLSGCHIFDARTIAMYSMDGYQAQKDPDKSLQKKLRSLSALNFGSQVRQFFTWIYAIVATSVCIFLQFEVVPVALPIVSIALLSNLAVVKEFSQEQTSIYTKNLQHGGRI